MVNYSVGAAFPVLSLPVLPVPGIVPGSLSKGRRVAAIYILQQMTAKRTDPMTPKANDTEFNENEAL